MKKSAKHLLFGMMVFQFIYSIHLLYGSVLPNIWIEFLCCMGVIFFGCFILTIPSQHQTHTILPKVDQPITMSAMQKLDSIHEFFRFYNLGVGIMLVFYAIIFLVIPDGIDIDSLKLMGYVTILATPTTWLFGYLFWNRTQVMKVSKA